MVSSVARRVSYSRTQIFEDDHCKQSMYVCLPTYSGAVHWNAPGLKEPTLALNSESRVNLESQIK